MLILAEGGDFLISMSIQLQLASLSVKGRKIWISVRVCRICFVWSLKYYKSVVNKSRKFHTSS